MRSRRRLILRRLRIWRHRRIGIRCALVPALRPFLVLFASLCFSLLLSASLRFCLQRAASVCSCLLLSVLACSEPHPSPLLPALGRIRLFLSASVCIGPQPFAPTHSARPDTFPEPVRRIYTGSRIENRLPLPISLSTEIVPPCASTNSFEMASPSPLPCTFVPGTRK